MKKKLSDYIFRSYTKRKAKNIFMKVILSIGAIIAIIPLISIFAYVLKQGLPAINLQFFTEIPKPVGETGGGLANAIVGTLIIVGISVVIGIPWGISIGTFLAEFGQKSSLSKYIRFSADMLASIPSIIIGLFIYEVMVVSMKRFSALAGGLALGILMIPTIARSTEELLKMIPTHIREAGLALGLPRWKVITAIVLKGIRAPMITAIMLSIARASGETAPLLFTAFNNQFWHSGIDQPIASIPVQVYTYAISPYDDWHKQAWAGALVLVLMVFTMNILTRVLFSTLNSRTNRSGAKK